MWHRGRGAWVVLSWAGLVTERPSTGAARLMRCCCEAGVVDGAWSSRVWQGVLACMHVAPEHLMHACSRQDDSCRSGALLILALAPALCGQCCSHLFDQLEDLALTSSADSILALLEANDDVHLLLAEESES